MRVFVYSSLKDSKYIKKLLLKNGFVVSKYKPDFIITYGGDGTTLSSEREFPGIPKLIVKTSKIAHSYEINIEKLKDTLKKIKKGNYIVVEEIKVEATFRNKKLSGINEVQVHTKIPIRALGFSVKIGDKIYNQLLGDGIVISTPFGSTAYYKSLGGKPFKKGLGIGFNNIHNKKVPCFRVDEKSVIEITINKGKGVLAADNNPKMYLLNPGDNIIVKKSEDVARFIKVL